MSQSETRYPQRARTLEQIADGIYRPGTDWVNWYLCDTEGAITLIGCGFRGYYEQVPAALHQLGRRLDALAAVVLTHYHPDHVGCAERVRREAGATVLAPAGDAKGVHTGKVPLPGGMTASLWRPVMMRYSAHAIRNGGARVTPVSEIQTYDDGELLDVPVGLRAIHTPGHTAGHCALVAEDHGVLFAGDALANVNFFTREQSPQTLPSTRTPPARNTRFADSRPCPPSSSRSATARRFAGLPPTRSHGLDDDLSGHERPLAPP